MTKLRSSVNRSAVVLKVERLSRIELVRLSRKSLFFRSSVDATSEPTFTVALRPNRMPLALIRYTEPPTNGALAGSGFAYCDFRLPKICDGPAGPVTRFSALESALGKLNVTLLAAPMLKLSQL